MAAATVSPEASLWQDRDGDRCWEEEAYQAGCAFARAQAQRQLRELEERLFQERGEGFRVEGFRKRRLMTRFGEIEVWRRLYRAEDGRYHFLLDEHLGWSEQQLASPGVVESVVTLAAVSSFREASKALAKLTAGVLSARSVQRLLWAVAGGALAEEKEAVSACFQEGDVPDSSGQVVERLYLEADGVWVRLQGEEQAHFELKGAIAYEGWQGEGDKRRLVGKRVYCHGLGEIDFWEGASLAFDRHWDLSRIRQVVIGGDGAAWIDEGVELFPEAVRQLDGFHLSRACGLALGKEAGARLYQRIREGSWQQANCQLLSLPAPERRKARAALSWLSRLIRAGKGMDWRLQVGEEAYGERGLGAMEGNIAQLLASRLKSKGRSWRTEGAYAMAKVRELLANDELAPWCYRKQRANKAVPVPKTRAKVRDTGQWLQAGLPVLTGPESSKPWVQSIKELAYPSHRLN